MIKNVPFELIQKIFCLASPAVCQGKQENRILRVCSCMAFLVVVLSLLTERTSVNPTVNIKSIIRVYNTLICEDFLFNLYFYLYCNRNQFYCCRDVQFYRNESFKDYRKMLSNLVRQFV